MRSRSGGHDARQGALAEVLPSKMKTEYQSRGMRDADIRTGLYPFLASKFRRDPSTVIANELGIRQGLVRVDVAAVNGSFYGFEIKSGADSLDRLPRQVAEYGRVLDYAAVVVAEKHRDAVEALLPAWWGILIAKPELGTIKIRRARRLMRNPAVDARALSELLWHDEALVLLDARNSARGLRSKPRALAWDRLSEIYSTDEIRGFVRAALKTRAARESAAASVPSDESLRCDATLTSC